MATLTCKASVYTVQWHPAAGGKRQTLGLGRVRRTLAESVRNHVAAIVSAQIHRAPLPDATAHWLSECGAALHRRLVVKGLAQPRDAAEATAFALDDMLKAYITRRTDLKPGTRTILGRTRNSLTGYFGKSAPISGISKAEAVDWHRSVRENLSGTTAHLYAKKARQMFNDAVDRRLIAENPFRKLKLGASTNPARLVYVPAADVIAVIDATPDPEWKLLFALARFAGVRVPSEVRELKWSDVALDVGRMTVLSPKTEHHEGRESRVVPIGAELAPLLTDALNAAEPGTVYVLPRLRLVTNHTTTAAKLIARAGRVPWVKTFQNLRASCETDWAVKFPIHVACAWAGNTTGVAVKHYLQVTDAHWSAASSAAEGNGNDRKFNELPNAETPVNTGGSGFSVAPEGPQPLAQIPLNPQILHRALHVALRRQARRLRRKGVPSGS